MAGTHSYTNLEMNMSQEESQVEPQVGGARRLTVAAVGLVALAGLAALAVCGWKPQDGPLLRADNGGLVGLSQDDHGSHHGPSHKNCSATDQPCQETGCCTTKGDKCYAINPLYAKCQPRQVVLTTTRSHQKKENCTQVAPGNAGNCLDTKWCCNRKLACIQKSSSYANCEVPLETYKKEQRQEHEAKFAMKKSHEHHEKKEQKKDATTTTTTTTPSKQEVKQQNKEEKQDEEAQNKEEKQDEKEQNKEEKQQNKDEKQDEKAQTKDKKEQEKEEKVDEAEHIKKEQKKVEKEQKKMEKQS